jgi:hypothetical protein
MPDAREQLTRLLYAVRAEAACSRVTMMQGEWTVIFRRDAIVELLGVVIDMLDDWPKPEHITAPPARCTCFDPEHALRLRTEALRTAPHTPIPHLQGCPLATVDVPTPPR